MSRFSGVWPAMVTPLDGKGHPNVLAIEALVEEAKVNDTTVSFEEFMRPQPPASVAGDASGDSE